MVFWNAPNTQPDHGDTASGPRKIARHLVHEDVGVGLLGYSGKIPDVREGDSDLVFGVGGSLDRMLLATQRTIGRKYSRRATLCGKQA